MRVTIYGAGSLDAILGAYIHYVRGEIGLETIS